MLTIKQFTEVQHVVVTTIVKKIAQGVNFCKG